MPAQAVSPAHSGGSLEVRLQAQHHRQRPSTTGAWPRLASAQGPVSHTASIASPLRNRTQAFARNERGEDPDTPHHIRYKEPVLIIRKMAGPRVIAAALAAAIVAADDPASSWLVYAIAPGNGTRVTSVNATWVVPSFPKDRNAPNGAFFFVLLRRPRSVHKCLQFCTVLLSASTGLLVWHRAAPR